MTQELLEEIKAFKHYQKETLVWLDSHGYSLVDYVNDYYEKDEDRPEELNCLKKYNHFF